MGEWGVSGTRRRRRRGRKTYFDSVLDAQQHVGEELDLAAVESGSHC